MYDEDMTKSEAWRIATITVILKMRLWAIRYGASALKVWDMLSERTRLATRRASSVESWASTIMRSFQISTVDSETSVALVELAGCVGLDVDEWLTFVTDEHQFLMAAARMRFDQERAIRKQRAAEIGAAVSESRELLEVVGEAKKPKRKKAEKPDAAPAQGELL